MSTRPYRERDAERAMRAGRRQRAPRPPLGTRQPAGGHVPPELRARRRQARRRRRLLRVDIAIGALTALVLLLASPGLAIAGAIALLVLLVCVASIPLARRRSQRGSSAKTAMSRWVRRS